MQKRLIVTPYSALSLENFQTDLESSSSNNDRRQPKQFEIRGPERLVANKPNPVEPSVRNFFDHIGFVEEDHRFFLDAADVVDSCHQRRVLSNQRSKKG
jgi:hypothetical protein